MNDIRIAFFDLDNTLLAADHQSVSPRNRAALARLKAGGTLLAVATGRSGVLLPDVIETLPFDYLMTSNGADITRLADRVHVHTAHIPAEDATAAWHAIRRRDMLIEWYIDGGVGIEPDLLPVVEDLPLPVWHKRYFALGGYPAFAGAAAYLAAGAPRLEKINLPRCDPAKREAVWHELEATGLFALSSSSGRNIEINTAGCSKGAAIAALLRHLGIRRAEAMAFGDGGNDVEMLRGVGIGVAMGGGVDAALEAAAMVAPRYEEDGVAHAIEAVIGA